MKTSDSTSTIKVEQPAAAAFENINNVRGWWSEEIEVNAEMLNDEFTYRYDDIHR